METFEKKVTLLRVICVLIKLMETKAVEEFMNKIYLHKKG